MVETETNNKREEESNMFKPIERKVRELVDVVIELEDTNTKYSAKEIRQKAVDYATEQMEGYKYSSVVHYDYPTIVIQMEKILEG